MTADDIVDQLVDLVDSHEAAKSAVAQLDTEDIVDITADLKQRALYYLRRDGPKALAIADLILNIGEWRQTPSIRALGLQTKATTLTLSQGEFEAALDLYEESEEIYKQYGADLDIALGQVSRIWALACLQRYEEAFVTAEWTQKILLEHQAYRQLAALNNNLAAVYGRRGHDEEALARIIQVEDAYARSGEEGQRRLPYALINRAILLRNLGRFDESIAANLEALDKATEYSQITNVARAEQNLGITYFITGSINQAHALLEKARDTFISDRRYHDAVLVDLFISDGLLYLGRHEEAVATCRQLQKTFQEAGIQF
ncbi:MAG: tetratricopeptide repeat protein, partial [Candidatus Promineifilaceae bacterium]|nr:tetratricopeptide repeat protein [Candidatus Promineifilaceae bacterium]